MGRYLVPGGQVGSIVEDAAGLSGAAAATGWVFTATSATNAGAAGSVIHTKLTGTLATNESCAIALWFKVAATQDQALAGVNMGSPGTLMALELNRPAGGGNGIYMSCRDADSSSGDLVMMTNNVRDGQPHHVVAMYDGNARQLRMYLDGNPSSNTTVTAESGSTFKTWATGIGIGGLTRTNAAPLRPFAGSLWDFQIMRFAPSQDEVQAIRSKGISP
jgi:hypothetical protein